MRMAEHIGPDAFLRQQKAIMARPDGRDDLSSIKCPTMILCGRQDALTPVEIHEEMAASIPITPAYRGQRRHDEHGTAPDGHRFSARLLLYSR